MLDRRPHEHFRVRPGPGRNGVHDVSNLFERKILGPENADEQRAGSRQQPALVQERTVQKGRHGLLHAPRTRAASVPERAYTPAVANGPPDIGKIQVDESRTGNKFPDRRDSGRQDLVRFLERLRNARLVDRPEQPVVGNDDHRIGGSHQVHQSLVRLFAARSPLELEGKRGKTNRRGAGVRRRFQHGRGRPGPCPPAKSDHHERQPHVREQVPEQLHVRDGSPAPERHVPPGPRATRLGNADLKLRRRTADIQRA